ncbi:MAG: hypothetical protein R2728_04015 [Chitinophagales bacterium]
MTFVFSINCTEAKTINVCPNCTIKTIKIAITSATPYDTILLQKGTYKEHELIIDKPLTLKGQKESIIDGEEKGNILLVDANYVTISGVTFINVGSSYTEDFAAIKLRRTRYCRVENNYLEKCIFRCGIGKIKVCHHKRQPY